MAYENVQLTNSNFCLTPQTGTFGTISTTQLITRLSVINTTGGLIKDYILSANILNEFLSIDYVGPLNLSGPVNGVTFFTLEKVNDTRCIIKRWELNDNFALLNLKQEITKYTTGNFYYDVSGMAVEHYNRTFYDANPAGRNYIDMNNVDKIVTGIKLFLGPSTDTDNVGAAESVTVSYVSGNRVYINSLTRYQYVAGDNVSFYNNIYLISNIGYGGDITQGIIFKLDAYTGAIKEYTTSGEYTAITGAKWSIYMQSIAAIHSTQILFINPYASYLNWRSIFLNNIKFNNIETFPVYDIVFDDYNLYKLMKFMTLKNDIGLRTTYSWSTYNYQQDTLLPYSNNVTIYALDSQLIGQVDNTTLYIQVRDQFGVGLRDVNVDVSIDEGDLGALLDPLNGQAITDINGEATIDYYSGTEYTGLTDVLVRADYSSVYTGSQYVWNKIRLKSDVVFDNSFGNGAIFQLLNKSGNIYSAQIYDPYKNTHYMRSIIGLETTVPSLYIISYSFFTTEGGNWKSNTNTFSDVYWPWFALPSISGVPQLRIDGPNTLGGGTWDKRPWLGDIAFGPRPNKITQLLDFAQHKTGEYVDRPLLITQPLYFLTYSDPTKSYTGIDSGDPPDIRATQKDCIHTLQFSQLKLSKHTHYVDGDPYDELFTYVDLDQFIFISDADPAFWSEKNPKETNIWIRMRPFAFDLDGTTLKFYVREVWTENDIIYDSRYYEVTSLGVISYFDAGGGILGLEFLYNPVENFHHNAIVYVHLEIYDAAVEPNFIYTDYWFKIIPDYNSPYLINMSPDREEDLVSVDTNIYFEIKDDGVGIDILTLEVFLNSRILVPTDIFKVSNYHYKITCNIPYDLQFGKIYSVGVVVTDLSENRNTLRDNYRFYTKISDAPMFTDFDPKICKRGMPRFREVQFVVLGTGAGVDESTIRLQVHDKDVTDKSNIIPIIYRIS